MWWGGRMATRRRAQPPASLPPDLCNWSDVAIGFGQLEQITLFSSALVLPTDPPGLPKSLAGEGLAHLVEGWRYLSAASSALLSNAKHQVVHLAYYAELRAAFALFACSGIRISKPVHWYLNNVGVAANPTWSTRATHQATWELWQSWANGPYADHLFSDRLRIAAGVELRAIGNEITRASATGSLLAWGFDLVHLVDDHSARNIASYEPTITKEPLERLLPEDLDYLREIWQLLQPTGTGLHFERLFVHYLLDLEIQEQASTGPFDEEAWRATIIRNIAGNTGASELELQTLLGPGQNPTQLFRHAANPISTWQSVMARAVFLLRLASKAVEDSMSQQPNSAGKPWLYNWLVHAGLLESAANGSASNLWTEFDDLPNFEIPTGIIPNVFRTDDSNSILQTRLTRIDATLAWSMSL
jgi:hypothetical protein